MLVIVNACQDSASKVHMNGDDRPSTADHAKAPNATALVPSKMPVSGHGNTNTQNESVSTLPVPSSNGSHSAEGAVEKLASPLQLGSANVDAKSIKEVVSSQDEKKEEVSQASPDLVAWFQRFVDVLDHAEEWVEVAGVLAEGKRYGYLDRGVAWDDDQYTPLHYAAAVGNLRAVKELAEKYSIPVDIKTDGRARTPLQFAAQEGHLDGVKFLVEQHYAKWEATDKEGANALHYAASGIEGDANVAVVQYLVETKNANPITKVAGFNILYLAIKVNNPELVRYLATQYPVLTQDVCADGISPIEFARATGKRTIVDVIEKAIKNVAHF